MAARHAVSPSMGGKDCEEETQTNTAVQESYLFNIKAADGGETERDINRDMDPTLPPGQSQPSAAAAGATQDWDMLGFCSSPQGMNQSLHSSPSQMQESAAGLGIPTPTLSSLVTGDVQMTSSINPTPNSSPEDMCLTLDESQDNKGTLGEQGWIAPHRQKSRQGSTHICKYYRRGGYRYVVKGRDCNFSHPRACPRFVTHGPFGDKGCKLGMKCSMFHPLPAGVLLADASVSQRHAATFILRAQREEIHLLPKTIHTVAHKAEHPRRPRLQAHQCTQTSGQPGMSF